MCVGGGGGGQREGLVFMCHYDHQSDTIMEDLCFELT